MKAYRTWCERCGWTSRPTTAGRADYALRLHSCDAHLRRRGGQARHRARRAAIDRTPQPCRHKQARHEHGTYAAYKLDRCRCWPCARAASVYNRNRQRQAGYGRWEPFVDAEPVRQHVNNLRASGLGSRRIADLAGVARSTVTALQYGKRNRPPTPRLRRDVADRLLAVRVDLDALGSRTPVDATGTRRRVQALVALGWSQARLAEQIGWLPSNFVKLTGNSTRTVSAGTARAVRDLYQRMCMTPPPENTPRQRQVATRARNHAKPRNWAPPLAWDDDDIDNPAAQPSRRLTPPDVSVQMDEVAVRRRIEGDRSIQLNRAERLEATRILHAQGLVDSQIAPIIGVDNPRTVLRYRQQLGLPPNDRYGRAA